MRVRYNGSGLFFMIRDNRSQLQRRTRQILLGLLLACAGSAFASSSRALAAPLYQPPGPDRFSVTTVDYTKYIWWMIRWGEEDVVCKIVVGHEACQRREMSL